MRSVSESDSGIAVRVSDLHKRFGRTAALTGASLTVPTGSLFLIVGQNGAGKTTLLKILLGLIRCDDGAAEVFGLDVWSSGRSVRQGVGWVPEGIDTPPPWFTVGALVDAVRIHYPAWDDGYATELILMFELDRKARYGQLSKGQRRRVQLLIALAHRPPLLIMDEPVDGIDPMMRLRVADLLLQHQRSTGATVVLSTHIIEDFGHYADSVAIMADGRVFRQMALDELASSIFCYRLGMPLDPDTVRTAGLKVLGRRVILADTWWTIEGDPAMVVQRLTANGAPPQDSRPASLSEAVAGYLSAAAQQ